MDKEFHYYVTGIIAYSAGFSEDDVNIIATASQMVDDNDITYNIENVVGSIYTNKISQTMDIFRSPRRLSEVYAFFHFVPPSDEDIVSDKNDNNNATIPNNTNAHKFLHEAFECNDEKRLYRIGIASHSFVDTWAHQNFVYYYDQYNINTNQKKKFKDRFNPLHNFAIGHGRFGKAPDQINATWQDPRTKEKNIDNNSRFMEAAEKLYSFYRSKLSSKKILKEWEELKEFFKETWEIPSQEKRIEKYKELLPPHFDMDYSQTKWFDEAIYTKQRGGKDSNCSLWHHFTIFIDKYYWKIDNEHNSSEEFEDIPKDAFKYKESKWYLYQESIKDHIRYGEKILGELFDRVNFNRGKNKLIKSLGFAYDIIHGKNHTFNVFIRIFVTILFINYIILLFKFFVK